MEKRLSSRKIVNFYASRETYQKFTKYCNKHGVVYASVLRDLLDKFVQEEVDNVKQG